MVCHVLINGRVARPKRVGSRGRIGAHDPIWSRVMSGDLIGVGGSHVWTRDSFPGSRAYFSGSREGILVFTIWL